MKLDVLLGLQWGDEGKGKIVDVLAPNYDIITRFQGGPNAGHTLEFNKIKHILHTIPSGVFRKDQINIVGNGLVLDPIVFKREIDAISKLGFDLSKRLFISKKAHLILPSHKILDAASEAAKGKTKIGSTLRGIAPTYMDKTGRNGLRVGDINSKDFHKKYEFLKSKHREILKLYDYKYNIEEYENDWFEGIKVMKQYNLVDSEHLINNYLDQGKTILAEGAQGTLLDIDFGSYPYVTSSNTICAGACTGLGLAPNKIGEVFGIFKAYSTRVGGGPFPTEQKNVIGKLLRDKGQEYGATTGRPRRCGWFDTVIANYSVRINGIDKIALTKLDVLDTLDEINICTAYRCNGKEIIHFPSDQKILEACKPVYETHPGWKQSTKEIKKFEDLPENAKKYLNRISELTDTNFEIISVGSERSESIRC